MKSKNISMQHAQFTAEEVVVALTEAGYALPDPATCSVGVVPGESGNVLQVSWGYTEQVTEATVPAMSAYLAGKAEVVVP